MSFEPQNDLERSLVKASGEPAHRPQFYKDFSNADIFIVQHGAPPPTEHTETTLSVGTTIQIQSIEHNGQPYIPIFSSLMRLQATLSQEVDYLGMNAMELMNLTQGAAMLLNPGSDYGKEFTRSEVASILDGSIWKPTERYTVQKEVKVMLGQPKNFPTELVDALSRFFKKKKQVKRAWIAHIFNPDDGQKQHTLIAVEVSGDFDELSAEAGIVINSVRIPDPPVDVMPITGKGGLEDYFLKQTKPFYERRFLGLF